VGRRPSPEISSSCGRSSPIVFFFPVALEATRLHPALDFRRLAILTRRLSETVCGRRSGASGPWLLVLHCVAGRGQRWTLVLLLPWFHLPCGRPVACLPVRVVVSAIVTGIGTIMLIPGRGGGRFRG